jgi:hypothetical protein
VNTCGASVWIGAHASARPAAVSIQVNSPATAVVMFPAFSGDQ